jgi:cell division protein FtsL
MKIKRKDIIFYGIIIILIIYIVFVDSASYYRRFQTKKKLETVEMDLKNLTKENERLQEENEKLEHDMDIWEKKARELGMQKEGDEVFMFKEETKKE